MLIVFALLTCFVLGFLFRLQLLELSRVHIRPTFGAWCNEPDTLPFVSVVIPARNEERNIRRLLRSLAAQTYPRSRFEVIVVDDGSEDRTRERALEVAESTAANIRCVPGRPLPKGWFGKSNACQVGAEQAQGDYLFFVDADTVSEPGMLNAVVSFAEERDIDLLSFNPRQRMVSVAEKVLMPGLFLGIASFMRFKQSNDPRSEEAIANGQAMLFRQQAYWAVEGHTVVAGEISEDLAFARAMKQRGFRIFWAFADELMSTRMYSSAGEIWQGFSKNMNRIIGCGCRTQAVWLLTRSLVLAWSPPLMLIAALWLSWNGHDVANALLIIALGLALVVLVAGGLLLRTLQVPLRYVWAIPFGLTLQGMLTLNAFRLASKRAFTWKGRTLEDV
ncbi:glycosyltransferase [Ferrimonas marina]|uniref:Chlorobactene glucosyltransferase n=1 Tax=Ferrimonas marina TaxID=299255 RepID=A0A1M5NT57_9GAMM|nr:glycosyltransferase family 2 protein [Ferrimonas marina]SHG92746.1 chlorobactene glucosyltransferase [Ferrimonas marina]